MNALIIIIFLCFHNLLQVLATNEIIPGDTPKDDSNGVHTSCHESKCGPNAVCVIKYLTPNNTTSYCTCRRGGYFGDPNKGCEPECESGAECGGSTVCSRVECVDACVAGFCGDNMKCEIQNYRPTCSCLPGYFSVDGRSCILGQVPSNNVTYLQLDVCEPNPCGRQAWCMRKTYHTPECVCIHNNGASPPNCRSQCDADFDCPGDKICRLNFCENAYGSPKGPISSCALDHCGPFTEKIVIGNRKICKCMPGYSGSPPDCHSECKKDSDCPVQMSCFHKTQKCVDPCLGACSATAICTVQNHTPVCICPSDSALESSDPFKICYYDPVFPNPLGRPPVKNETLDVKGRCGSNAKLKEENSGPCVCQPGFEGSPPNCKNECTRNSDCPSMKTCVGSKCVNTCTLTCGTNAQCSITNNTMHCSCFPGFSGDPYQACTYANGTDLCENSPCGQNATCEFRDGIACCNCFRNYFGDPYAGCIPECSVNSDCPALNVCLNNNCIDPCPGLCGLHANCKVENHVPMCTCASGSEGNPYLSCAPNHVTNLETQP